MKRLKRSFWAKAAVAVASIAIAIGVIGGISFASNNQPFLGDLTNSYPCQIERRRILFLCAALLLHVALRQSLVHGIVDHPAVFIGGNAPSDAVLCGFVKRCVLAHDAGDEALGVCIVPRGHLVKHRKAVVNMAGQGKVPQNDPLLQDALCIEHRVPGLCHHGFNGGLCLRKIVRRGRKLCGKGRGYIF